MTKFNKSLIQRSMEILNFKKKKALQKQIDIIRSSDFFDDDWYLNQYADVKKDGMDPVRHYVFYGAAEGRNPGPEFDTQMYLNQYPDVKHSSMSPLCHYLMFGKKEVRIIDRAFSEGSEQEEQTQELQETDMTNELEQENELLLLQLHQVQEELESYFLKSQKLEAQVEQVTQERDNSQVEQVTQERDNSQLRQSLNETLEELTTAQHALQQMEGLFEENQRVFDEIETLLQKAN